MTSRMLFVKFLLASFLLSGLLGCGGFKRSMPSYPRAASATPSAAGTRFSQVIESFYGSRTVEEAAEWVDKAQELAPEDVATHEIAGHLARLRGEEAKAFEHYYLALATPDNRMAFFHLDDLLGVSMTANQYREALALFSEILEEHPDGEIKSIVAAFAASWQRRLEGSAEDAEAALAFRGDPIDYALISAFDNEDGQGFSVEYAPEREIDYTKEYAGTQLAARWRTDVPLDHQNNLSFGELVSPGLNVVAYAATYVFVPGQGEYTIRVTTSDAIKLWLNDIPVLSQQRVEDDAVDQFRVPVVLREGWNKLLVKSCHQRGSWLLGLNITDQAGGIVPGLKTSSGPEEVGEGPPPGKGYDFDEDFEGRFGSIGEPLRKKYYATRMAHRSGLLRAAQNRADDYRTASPLGLMARLQSALTAWDAGQLGLTIDVLDTLIGENEEDGARLRVLRAQYFSGQERPDKARKELLGALEINPRYRSARSMLAQNYAGQGWAENHLEARLEDVSIWPDDTPTLWGLASAYEKLGRKPEAEEIYREILSHWRGASDILETVVNKSLSRSEYKRALRFQKKLIALFPSTPSYYLRLGDILRRVGDVSAAEEAYEHCLEIDNRWSTPFKRLGAMAYERGDVEDAVANWRRSLELDPDNHSLADRLEYIAAEEDSLFDSFVPDAETIRKVLSARHGVEVHTGSNMVFLLDHAVAQVSPDGSIRQVVTQAITAVNDTGRDSLTKQRLPYGRVRVVEAYAVDPDGSRYEASSVRGGSVRFRELKVGSTVVLQYRLDEYPGGYLSRYLSRRWFFHGPNSQFEDSHYVLLVPEEMQIQESGHGKWKRQDAVHGDRRVLEYRARKVPPLVPEPFSPPIPDLLDQVSLSSIPDWDTIAGWDMALLVDAFRSTPETKELAKRLTEEASTKKEKLAALTRFVMREIRYQQDYENTIAGVKPHPAPIVLQRAYGDCKDKSVLLMTLADEVGIETRFVLLRTTGAGKFVKELPALQFNHAIVYVPRQDGLDEAFFIDGTPDTLDLATLRPDSQNTWAMVIDPKKESWDFVRIPLAPAETQFTLRRIRVEPRLEGPSQAQLELTFQGPAAAAVRAVLRNMDDTRVFAAQLASSLFPSPNIQEVAFTGEDDIVRPVTLTMTLESEGLARRQGDEIVVELPKSENLSRFVSLASRRLPLQTSLYRSLIETEEQVVLPEGYGVQHLPESQRVENQFFAFERKVERKDGTVRLGLRFEEKKQRIDPAEYEEFRAAINGVVENLNQDLVLQPEGKSRRNKKK